MAARSVGVAAQRAEAHALTHHQAMPVAAVAARCLSAARHSWLSLAALLGGTPAAQQMPLTLAEQWWSTQVCWWGCSHGLQLPETQNGQVAAEALPSSHSVSSPAALVAIAAWTLLQ